MIQDIEQGSIVNESLSIGESQVNAFGDRFFSNLNPGTFIKLKANDFYDAHFGPSLFKTNSIFVILGTDSGLLPHYIQEKGIPEGSRYVFIEPAPILKQLQQSAVFDDLDEEYIICSDMSTYADAFAKFKIDDYLRIGAVVYLNGVGAQANVLDLYAELGWTISDILQQLHYKINTGASTEPFIIQQLNNLADSLYSAGLLKRAFLGKTAIILAGGPSLDDALPWIKANRDKIVIIAVSRVARRLIQVGIDDPDFIVSVDPGAVNFDVSKDIYALNSKTIFIYGHHIYNELVSQWSGLAFYTGPRVPWHSSLNDNSLYVPGPTVTNVAVSLAYQLGFKRIFLAGADFSYTKDGFTHAKGTIEQAAGARFNYTGIEVETYSGEMASTGLDYNLAREMLVEQVKPIIQSASCQIFNVSFYAAKVEGVEYAPLNSIELDHDNVDARAIVQERIKAYDVMKLFPRLHMELHRVLYQLKEIQSIAQQALKCNEEMYDEFGMISDYKDKRRLDKLEQLLKRKHRHYSRLVQTFGIRSFLKITKPFDDDSWTAEEVQRVLRVYYKSYVDATAMLIVLLEKAEQKLVAREEEHKSIPDWDLIIAHCRQEQCFGRVRLWRKLNSAAQLSAEQQVVFEEFEQAFVDVLNKTKTAHGERAKKQSSLSFLRSRAQMLFQNQKEHLLKDLLLAIDKHEDQEGVKPYRYLIEGYIAQLHADYEAALNYYHQVIEGGGALIEDALLQIAIIDIQSETKALAHPALECLAQINTKYLLIYAESCRLHGDFLEAVDTYNRYLTAHPNDVIVQLKLAQLYIAMKVFDGAELMLDFILKNNPQQETALILKRALASHK